MAIGKGYMLSSIIDEAHRWNVAFGLAAIGMLISLINFYFTKRHLGPIGLQPGHPDAIVKTRALPKWVEYAVYLGTLLLIPVIQLMVSKTEYTDYFMYTIGPLTLIYLFYEMSKVEKVERHKLWAALVFILFSIIFWGIYEQSGGSLSIFAAKNLNDSILGGLVHLDPNGVNNSGGALFIIALAPLFGIMWIWIRIYLFGIRLLCAFRNEVFRCRWNSLFGYIFHSSFGHYSRRIVLVTHRFVHHDQIITCASSRYHDGNVVFGKCIRTICSGAYRC